MTDNDRPVLDEIEITEAMVEAGLAEIKTFRLGEPLSRLAEAVYLAMEIERSAAKT